MERMNTVAPKFSRDQVKAFIKDNDLKTMADVQSALKELFADTLPEMLISIFNDIIQ
ncbi:hypothetical protein U9M73_17070 [Paenibacillus phoenicis]|uniref:Uncharacterized protein n=3 Tax=Paenibacillus TaxID=44249 RepID=R9L4P6_9BACL|nr:MULTISPECIES: hypothetical protein [Paenibacillus]EOS53523.1 hypothetical protein C812_04074 [Paenibacillus barengoltzii G22]MEA3571662.1 hypothetical protein [Paenibacillus phoenicis]MEC2345358.1 hypothetical protein [Paenibacillus barengoltzii]